MRLSPAAVWLDSRLYKVSSIPPIIRFAAIFDDKQITAEIIFLIPAVSHSSYRGSRCGSGDSRRIHYRSRRFLKLFQAECPAVRFRSGSSRPANSWDNLRDPAAWDPCPPEDPVFLNIPYNRKLLKKYILIVFYRTKSVDIYTILVYNVLEMRFSSTWTHKIDKNSTVQVLRIISRWRQLRMWLKI